MISAYCVGDNATAHVSDMSGASCEGEGAKTVIACVKEVGLARPGRSSGRGVGENVHRLEAREIEPRPLGQIAEGRARKAVAALARQHRVELFAQRVQVQHVGGGVGELRLAQRAAPQSELCCCLERSTPSNSLTRSFRPCRSV